MTRKITPVEINGKSILVEYDEIELVLPESTRSGSSDDLDDGFELVGNKQKGFLKQKVADIGDMVSSVVSSVDKGMSAVKPDEWSVEFTIGYTVEKDIKVLPFISGKGEAKGGVKVTATWKADKPKGSEGNT